ncbi:hypothetical protein ACFC08_28565 [Streptomyces sp. NPDC056112]|uniref:hypothetical protein n=1 Tax=Streptomyces sp. NPDC056112 TaxID=3345715 RepID=UPI0035E1E14B
MQTVDPLRAAEDELQRLRVRFARVAAFIHNPAHCADARRSLARDLGLPEPTPEKPQ